MKIDRPLLIGLLVVLLISVLVVGALIVYRSYKTPVTNCTFCSTIVDDVTYISKYCVVDSIPNCDDYTFPGESDYYTECGRYYDDLGYVDCRDYDSTNCNNCPPKQGYTCLDKSKTINGVYYKCIVCSKTTSNPSDSICQFPPPKPEYKNCDKMINGSIYYCTAMTEDGTKPSCESQCNYPPTIIEVNCDKIINGQLHECTLTSTDGTIPSCTNLACDFPASQTCKNCDLALGDGTISKCTVCTTVPGTELNCNNCRHPIYRACISCSKTVHGTVMTQEVCDDDGNPSCSNAVFPPTKKCEPYQLVDFSDTLYKLTASNTRLVIEPPMVDNREQYMQDIPKPTITYYYTNVAGVVMKINISGTEICVDEDYS